MKARIDYQPQPKQAQLHRCAANEILYGGSAGPGKSVALRMEALIWALRISGLQVYLFRRTFPELEKNHILPSRTFFPKDVGKYSQQKRRWEFSNGSMIHFSHCQHESDVFNYQGAEIHLLLIDELTTFAEFMYDYLRGRVRCTLPIPEKWKHKIPGITCASNPGGIGHEFVKRRWVDFAKPFELRRTIDKEGGMLRCYIPGLLEDNKILMDADPNYIHRLDALPEPYRTAYMKGDWDIFLGQAFNFNKRDHVIDPIPVPSNANLYMSFDWGYGAPFSVLWWWVDNDGRLYLFDEWYGWNGTPNEGLRLTDPEIAAGIKEREERLGIDRRDIFRLSGPDCFNKKPDYKGGGQGPSTAEEFARQGLYLAPGDPSRQLKIRQFRERLRVPDDGTMPMLVVYSICEQFIRTLPLIQTDDNNVEDVSTKGEVHHYDAAAIMCMARPIAMELTPTLKNSYDRRIEALYEGTGDDEFERQQLRETVQTNREYDDIFDFGDLEYFEDGDRENDDLMETM
jgi:hypothetical protein